MEQTGQQNQIEYRRFEHYPSPWPNWYLQNRMCRFNVHILLGIHVMLTEVDCMLGHKISLSIFYKIKILRCFQTTVELNSKLNVNYIKENTKYLESRQHFWVTSKSKKNSKGN